MARQPPGIAFRDRARIQSYIQDGPRRRVFGEWRDFDCHWEGKGRLRSSDGGARRHVLFATVYVPYSEFEERNYRVFVDRETGFRRVGSRVGVGLQPGSGLVLPFGVSRTQQVTEVRSRPAAVLHLEDRIEYDDVLYQITDFREYDGPRGPDHYVLRVVGQKGP